MTPKEKAKELLRAFSFIEYDQKEGVKIHNPTLKEAKKQCALICVEEVIKQLDEMCKPEYYSFWHGEKVGETVDGYAIKEYWEQVKTEIESI